MNLKGAVALVTGGGTGIGRAVSLALADGGAAAVAVNYARSEADAEAAVRELTERRVKAVAIKADVSHDTEVRSLVDGVVSRFGRLDILVNNAGTTEFIPLQDLEAVTDEVWDEIFDVNLRGAFYCARAAAPHLRAARGSIVNVSSIAAHRGGGSSLPYALSKAGVTQLTRVLAMVLAPEVTVNAVSPGMVVTRWARVRKGEDDARAAEERSLAATPLQRNADPSDIADAVMGLLRSSFVTGQDLLVDGGRSVKMP